MRAPDTELITRIIHSAINDQCGRLKAEWTGDDNNLVIRDLDTGHRYSLSLAPVRPPQEGAPTYGTDHLAATRHMTLRPWRLSGAVTGICGARLTRQVSPDANGMTNCPACYTPLGS